MISHSVSHEFEEIRFSVFDNVLFSLLSGMKACQSVVAVNSGTGNTHGYGSWNNTIRHVLVGRRCRNGILIVSAQEQSLASQSGCKVESCREVSLTGSAFSEVDSGYLFLSCCPESVP